MSVLDLFKSFARGQENAQDQLNDNFEKLDGLIESGSNENGNWIKFADGTMICHGYLKARYSQLNRQGIFINPEVRNFPQAFVGVPSVTCSRTKSLMNFYCVS